jgi:hypothetical protein
MVATDMLLTSLLLRYGGCLLLRKQRLLLFFK